MVGRVCGIEGTNSAEGSEIRRDLLPRSAEIGRYWLGDLASGDGEGGEGGGEGGDGGGEGGK